MIRAKDKPYIEAMRQIQGENVTSEQIDQAVYEVNRETGMYYNGGDVIRILQFCDLIDIQSHLGQPRHGELINQGRLHIFTVLGG